MASPIDTQPDAKRIQKKRIFFVESMKIGHMKLLAKTIAQIVITGHYPVMNTVYVVPAHLVKLTAAVPVKLARWARARIIVRRY